MHDGHKALLDNAISQNEHLIIGLTTDELLKNKKYPEFIQAYEERKQSIINYLPKVKDNLETLRFNGKIYCRLLALHDKFGPTIVIQLLTL